MTLLDAGVQGHSRQSQRHLHWCWGVEVCLHLLLLLLTSSSNDGL